MGTKQKAIKYFRGKNAFLDNGYPVRIEYEGMTFPSVEAAFQAAKSWDVRHRLACSKADTPVIAKRLGRKVALRPDWEEKKLAIMKELLEQKFRYFELRHQLLSTGDAELVAGNQQGDGFWGQVKGEGENHLGRLLMEVREEIRAEETDSNTVLLEK